MSRGAGRSRREGGGNVVVSLWEVSMMILNLLVEMTTISR